MNIMDLEKYLISEENMLFLEKIQVQLHKPSQDV